MLTLYIYLSTLIHTKKTNGVNILYINRKLTEYQYVYIAIYNLSS